MTPKISIEQMEAIEEKARVDDSTVRVALATIPASWNLIERLPAGGTFRRGSLQVIFTVQRYDDGRVWLHVSACGRTGRSAFYLPSWDEMKRVKHDFIGPDRWAVSVLPDERNYINHNPYVLHLYALLDRKDRPALPDFTWGLGTL